jgi:hypothetical protein
VLRDRGLNSDFELLVLLGVSSKEGDPELGAAAQAYRQRLSRDPLGVTEAIAIAVYVRLFPTSTTPTIRP